MDKQIDHLIRSSTWWFSRITVEPSMALYMFAFMITSVVEQDFFVQKACLVNHNYTLDICENLQNYTNITKEVQITVSNFHQWNNISTHLFPIILAMFLGSWSDRRGRKFPLIIGLCGKLIYSIMIIVNASNYTWPLEYVTYTATIPCALTGADLAIFASCFSYISDVSKVAQRTFRIAILEVSYLITIPTGVALGSYLFNEVFNKSYSLMFAINVCLLCIAIIYSFCRLKWQTTEKQKSLREMGCCGVVGDFFDKTHVVDSFNVLFKPRKMHRRLFLFIFLSAMALYAFQRDEKQYLYLYTQLKFNWGMKSYSMFKTFQSSAYCILTFISVPLMSRFLKWKDTVIIFIGALAHAFARVAYLLANAPWIFYCGSLISGLGPVVAPVLRSMVSKTVSVAERGKIFALLAVCDNAVPFLSGILYTQTYNATIGKVGGIFLLTIATQIGVFLLTLIVHTILGDNTFAIDEENKADSLIDNCNADNKPNIR